MEYAKITVHTTTAGAEVLGDLLAEAGAGGAVIEDAADLLTIERDFALFDGIEQKVFDAMPQGDVRVSGYLPADGRLADSIAALKERIAVMKARAGTGFGTCEIDISRVDEADWANEWKKYFKPLRVGRFLVKPTWEPYEKTGDELIIELDPGMAFGTGTHETTRLCMERLEHFAKGLSGASVLDVGCGSGILSIAAAKLGARVTAIDLDPVCVASAKENAARNGLSGAIDVRLGNLLDGGYEETDLIVANIISDVIIAMAPAAARALKLGGVFISSGITKGRAGEVRMALSEAGFIGKETFIEGEWAAISCFRGKQ